MPYQHIHTTDPDTVTRLIRDEGWRLRGVRAYGPFTVSVEYKLSKLVD